MNYRSGAKKPPSPIQFDPYDPLHLEFVLSAAFMRAQVYGVIVNTDEIDSNHEPAIHFLASVTVEQFR